MKSNPVFLLLTDLVELKPEQTDLVAIDSCCFKAADLSCPDERVIEILPSLYQDSWKEMNSPYIQKLINKFLSVISKELSVIHEVNYSVRAWRILLEPWLIHMISNLFYRYSLVNEAVKKYPNLTTTLLTTESFVGYNGNEDFYTGLHDPIYSLQLYTRIFHFLGHYFPETSISKKSLVQERKSTSKLIKKLLVRMLNNFLRALSFRIKVLSVSSYLPSKVIRSFSIRSFFKIINIRRCDFNIPCFKINSNVRDNLFKHLELSDEFEALVAAVLPQELPKCYLEGFSVYSELAKRQYPYKPKVILSAVGWSSNDVFRFYAAQASDSGMRLIGVQHGGNYGFDKELFTRKFEMEITDKYYTWGEGLLAFDSNVCRMPLCKLVGKKQLTVSDDQKDILYVFSAVAKSSQLLRSYCCNQGQYITWMKAFYSSLPASMQQVLLFRPPGVDLGWKFREYIDSFACSARIQAYSTPFQQGLKNCRICVVDHASSVMCESLALNKPTIIFFDKYNNHHTQYANVYLDKLRSVGILYDSPQAAAGCVERIYDNIDAWWKDTARQEAISEFCLQYAFMPESSAKIWYQELMKQCE